MLNWNVCSIRLTMVVIKITAVIELSSINHSLLVSLDISVVAEMCTTSLGSLRYSSTQVLLESILQLLILKVSTHDNYVLS